MNIQSKMVRVEVNAESGMRAYMARPEQDENYPHVILLMEAFGLVNHIRNVVDKLAMEGFVVISPDLYYRLGPDSVASYDDVEKAIAFMDTLDDAEFIEDIKSVISFIKSSGAASGAGSTIGVMGFCMGGRLSFLSAAELPVDISACAVFYGGGIGSLLPKARSVNCPLALFFGEKDEYIPAEEVAAVKQELTNNNKNFSIDTYKNAQHGFCCDERPSFDKDAAEDSFEKLLDFLHRNLVAQ